MRVLLHKGQLDYFRRKARNAAPLELYAVLVGEVKGDDLEIHRIAYPALEEQTVSMVAPDMQSLQEIEDEATEEGLQVVGSIHSHPNALPIMSRQDHISHKHSGDLVSGIVEVTNRKTRVVFWSDDSPLQLPYVYF